MDWGRRSCHLARGIGGGESRPMHGLLVQQPHLETSPRFPGRKVVILDNTDACLPKSLWQRRMLNPSRAGIPIGRLLGGSDVQRDSAT